MTHADDIAGGDAGVSGSAHGEMRKVIIIDRHRKGLATKTEVRALVAEVEALRSIVAGVPTVSAEVLDWLTEDDGRTCAECDKQPCVCPPPQAICWSCERPIEEGQGRSKDGGWYVHALCPTPSANGGSPPLPRG